MAVGKLTVIAAGLSLILFQIFTRRCEASLRILGNFDEDVDEKFDELDEEIRALLDEWDRELQNLTDSPTQNPIPSPSNAPTFTPTGSPVVSPTIAPTGSPIESPSLNPTGNPISSTVSTDAPSLANSDGLSGPMIWGMVGFALLALALIVLFVGFYTTRTTDSAERVEEPQGGQVILNLPPTMAKNQRESMSTVFSRDRLSTWSGNYSDKVEALPGKDEGFLKVLRDNRHERNIKKEKKKARAKESPRQSITTRSKRQLQVVSVEEVEADDDDAATDVDNSGANV